MSDDTGKPSPTSSEAMFFFNIVQHMKNKAEIDWDAVAVSTGFKNAGVAKVRFGQIKRKHGLDGESPARSPAGKKNGKQPGDGGPSTPTKVTKPRKAPGSGRGRRVKKQEEPEDDLDEDGTSTTIKAEKEDEDEEDLPEAPFPAVKEEAGGDWVDVKDERAKDGDFTYF
ncbi:hypothetical protein PWT90_10944 [Aphanocladium album]|nr:hypothetical protein PWT90_10944 [Aphanocladium album]